VQSPIKPRVPISQSSPVSLKRSARLSIVRAGHGRKRIQLPQLKSNFADHREQFRILFLKRNRLIADEVQLPAQWISRRSIRARW
jgi:hypothetical protein